MNKHLLSLLSGLLLSFLPDSFAQQPTEEWSKRYNGVGTENISPIAIAVDAEGNSYITGTTRHSYPDYDVASSSIITFKISPAGEKLWEKVYRKEQTTQATAIAVDEQSGVYITGIIGNWEGEKDIVTIRYDIATGEESWVQRYDGPAGGSDEVQDIATDNKGGIYITGSSSNFPGGIVISDFITVRYEAATGKEVWVKRYNGPANESDGARAIAVDGGGGVYVTGYSYRESSTTFDATSDFATIRYDAATGKQIWVQRYDGPTNGNDAATAIAVDNMGGVFVTGTSSGENTNEDFATVRYDADTGKQAWVQRYNGPSSGFTRLSGIAVDNQGGVFITGSFSNFSKGAVIADYTTIRYEATTGEETWVQLYDGPANGFDQANAIAVDNNGGVYVTGFSFSKDSSYDYATIRYDAPTGKQDWIQRYNGPSNSNDGANAIAINNSGWVYVTGGSTGGKTIRNIATISYNSATGQERWVNKYALEGNLSDKAIAIAVDAAGNSYITGTSSYQEDEEPFNGRSSIVTIKYSPSGEELWIRIYSEDFNSRASAIAVDNKGGVYVTGYTPTLFGENTLSDYVTIRYDAATGEQTWVQLYDGPANSYDGARAITADGLGGLYVTGISYGEGTGSDYATIRYDAATGEQTWVQRYNGSSKSYEEATAIAIDNSGGLYVTGNSSGYATIRYEASTGREIWVQRYAGEGQSDYAEAIAVDNAGGVYITGTSYRKGIGAGSDFATIRYNATTGKESWVARFSGEEDGHWYNSNDITVDNQGGVYVTGYRYGDNDTDFTTLRYNAATGKQQWVSYFDGEDGSSDLANAIAADDRGFVYITGYSFGGGSINEFRSVFSTVKYSAADGKLVWDAQTEGQSDRAVAMALDKDNNIIITGYSFSSTTREDFLTVKYSQQAECPVLADAAIKGKPTAAVKTSGSVYSLAASGANSFTWSITDGNGNSYTKFTGQGTGSISVDWPSSPQVYKLSVTYGGTDGCPTKTVTKFVHVFDPAAGFVTGGGWSDFPANAAFELMQREGKAHWSFVAKYKKGDVTEGAFLLKVNDYTFHSTSIKDGSLVIAGDKAYFQGQGTLTYRNNSGKLISDTRSFGYLIAAIDAQYLQKSKGQKKKNSDKLRILIWVIDKEKTQGAIVFDSQPACSSANLEYNAPACDAIEQGSIVIHKQGMKHMKSESSLIAGENTESEEMVVYPNAFSDRAILSFRITSSSAYKVELYDRSGAMVKQVIAGVAQENQRYEHEINAEGLANGLYFARLTSGSQVLTVKLVVQR
ncbi:SBBP repeat-containing protein [Pontibacter locisalis]|uniref:SBBP repeat-containing protein n=1 Tax=Pontibacter locisalis TaxID=1719035 RepID=A0ABW5IJB7_9BACT